jgi:hypothetical protein
MSQVNNDSMADLFNDLFFSPFLFPSEDDSEIFSLTDAKSEKKENSNISSLLIEKKTEFSIQSNLPLTQTTNNISNQINNNTNGKNFPFQVKKQNFRGRKRKIKRGEAHDKYWPDNIKRKILVHSINSLIKYTNLVLNRLGYEDKFYKIKAKCKTKEKKNELISIKKKNIGQILSQEISPKFKKIDINININACKKLENEPIISNLLSENYSTFIKDIYCKYEKKINLGRYGLTDKYIICNIERYMDLIDKNKNDKRYIEKLKEYFNNYFLN